MRALAISDTHFGAWTGDDLLAHPYALERLAPHLEGIDELILLGDLFDFLFSTVEHAVARAQGFLDLVADRLRGRRVVFLAGNHDHHTMVRELEDYESVIVPLTELLYAVAQLPHGTAAQQSVYDQIGRLGRLLAVPGAPARGAKKVAGWAADGMRAVRDRSERRAVADVHPQD